MEEQNVVFYIVLNPYIRINSDYFKHAYIYLENSASENQFLEVSDKQ
jgi:hypothetical protein